MYLSISNLNGHAAKHYLSQSGLDAERNGAVLRTPQAAFEQSGERSPPRPCMLLRRLIRRFPARDPALRRFIGGASPGDKPSAFGKAIDLVFLPGMLGFGFYLEHVREPAYLEHRKTAFPHFP